MEKSILILNTWFCDWIPDEVRGSPENAKILSHLKRKGWQLFIIHPDGAGCGKYIDNVTIPAFSFKKYGRVGRYLGQLLNYFIINWRFWRAGRRVLKRRRFGMVLAVGSLPAPAAFLLGKEFKIKKIVKTPGTFELVRVNPLRRCLFYYSDVTAFRLGFDHFLLVDDGTATYRYLESIGKRNYTLLPNPYPEELKITSELRDRMRYKLGIPNNAGVAGWAARFHKLKGIEYLPRIVNRILEEGFYVIIAGTESEEFPFKHERLKVLGFLRSKEMVEFYSAIDVFMSTNIYSQYVLPVLEAQSLGIPVVGFNELESYKAILEGETGFLINNRNVNEFVGKVLLLLKDTELRKRMGERARRFIKEKHISWREREILEERALLKILEDEETG